MFCKNCGNKLNDNDKFCVKCGIKVENEKNTIINNNVKAEHFKAIEVLFIISLILFLIIMIINIFFMRLYINEPNGMAGLFLFFSMLLTGLPFFVLIILSIINLVSIIKHKKNGINIPTKIKILGIINILFIPTIILFFTFGGNSKENQHNDLMSKKLDEIYGESYEILDTCSYSNTGGDYYMEALLNLSGFEYPVIAHLDLNDNSYSDNYNDLLRTKNLNYQSHIDTIFNEETLAWMIIDDNNNYDDVVDLNIIINKKHLNDQNILKNNIKQISNKYMSQFPNYNFNLSIYFTRKIDKSKINDYYVLLNGGGGSCDHQFSKKINKSELKLISIRIEPNTDIDLVIEDSIRNIIYLSDRY